MKKFLKSKSKGQQGDHESNHSSSYDEQYKCPIEPLKSPSEALIPQEAYQHLLHMLRGILEGYMKSTYGADSKNALDVSYSVDDKFFEPYIKMYYKGLLSVFSEDEIKNTCNVLMSAEIIMYEQALKVLTSIYSVSLYEMCKKTTGFDSENESIH